MEGFTLQTTHKGIYPLDPFYKTPCGNSHGVGFLLEDHDFGDLGAGYAYGGVGGKY